MIGPSPTYSTHSSGEAAHAGQRPVCYRLDPDNNWYPDLDDIRSKVTDKTRGIVVINCTRDTALKVFPVKQLEGTLP